MHFCDRKCFVETPAVLIFHLMCGMTIVYIMVYSDMAANLGAWSQIENYGYFLFIGTNFLYLCIVVWIIYFFHKFHRKHYRQPRFVLVNVFLGMVYGMGLGALFCLTHKPSKWEMKQHLLHKYFELGYIPGTYEQLQKERKCCGVYGYTDYINSKKGRTPFPDSCCKRFKPKCGNTTVDATAAKEFFHTMGCVKNSIEEIENTDVYLKTYLLPLFAMFPSFFPLATIIAIQLVICLTKPKNELPFLDLPSLQLENWGKPSPVHLVFRAPSITPDDVASSTQGEGRRTSIEVKRSKSKVAFNENTK